MRAGPLTAERRGAALCDVRWGGLEIASSIHVTLRDERWRTLRPSVLAVEEEERADGSVLRLDADYGEGLFTCRLLAHGGVDGSLALEIRGEAQLDFVYRRIGICVLHPWTDYVGARYEATGARGATIGTFPREIAPQPLVDGAYAPMIPAFTRLSIAFAGSREATFDFEGEELGFELEDQRNWTDASFKTYPTPLAASAPRTIRRGERRWQRLTLRVNGPDRPPEPEEDGAVTVAIGPVGARPLPEVGITAPSAPVDLEPVRALHPAHLRVAVRPSSDPDVLGEAAALAREVGAPLEVVVLAEDDDVGLGPIAAMLTDAPVRRLLVLRRSGATTGGAFASRLRDPWTARSVALGGGTCSHFSELNRDAPDRAGLDLVALAMSPQVHEEDEAMMVETLEIQTQVVRQARALCDDLPVVVSPVTLAAHQPPEDVGVDPRVTTPFAAAWTVGSAAALAEGGASSVTFHEEVDRTVLPSQALRRAIGLLTALGGRPLRGVRSSAPRRIRAIAAADSAPILVNLTARPQRVQVLGAGTTTTLGPYEVAVLDGLSR